MEVRALGELSIGIQGGVRGGGLLARVGRITSLLYRVSRARRAVGMIACSWARGQHGSCGHSSLMSVTVRLWNMKACLDLLLTTL